MGKIRIYQHALAIVAAARFRNTYESSIVVLQLESKTAPQTANGNNAVFIEIQGYQCV